MRLAPLVAVVVAACFKVDNPNYTDDFDAAVADAPPADASLACEPDTVVCDDDLGRYVDCDATGMAELVIDCPLGCSDSEEKCVDVDPSNGLAVYLDMAPSGPEVAFAGTSSIDGVSVYNGATSIEVPNFVVDGMQVFVFRSLSVAGTLRITGEYPVVFVVDRDVTITGTVDLSANGWMPGPGGIAGYDGAVDACNGGTYSGATPSPGAGGGGHYQAGGVGGSTTTAGGSAGGMASGLPELQPLRGGCAGGATLETEQVYGGGGGGAFQITSRSMIAITGSGAIDASGGGSNLASGTTACGGGGGGAGGAVLLEAPQVVLDGASVVVSTKGGGGSAVKTSGTTWPGQDGGTTSTAAAGGTNGSLPGGGAGGTETTAPAAGQSAATSTQDGGGGGGSVGRVRFNTSGGAINPQQGAAIRSRYTTGPLRTRLVP